MIERANSLRAVRTIYPKSWKLGECPIVEDLGSIPLPDNWHDTEAEMICRKHFPKANGYTAFDEFGQVAVMAINLL